MREHSDRIHAAGAAGRRRIGSVVKDISKELQLVNADGLRASFYDIVAKSTETQTSLRGAVLDGGSRRGG